MDPQDVEMLQDLVISAVNEALRQADEAMSNSMNSLTGGLNIPGLLSNSAACGNVEKRLEKVVQGFVIYHLSAR